MRSTLNTAAGRLLLEFERLGSYTRMWGGRHSSLAGLALADDEHEEPYGAASRRPAC